jgi:hypothetical protein
VLLQNLGDGDEFGVPCSLLGVSLRMLGAPTYIETFVGVVHAPTDDFSVVDENASDWGFVRLKGSLCLLDG